MRFLYKESAFTVSIYTNLRRKVNFKEYRKGDVKTAIANSLYSAVMLDGKCPIDTARIVGDGRIALLIEDMMANPVYQKNQTGSPLTQKPQEYLAGAACGGAYIGLVSIPSCVPSYKKYGFLEYPYDGMEPDMVKFYDPYEVKK